MGMRTAGKLSAEYFGVGLEPRSSLKKVGFRLGDGMASVSDDPIPPK